MGRSGGAALGMARFMTRPAPLVALLFTASVCAMAGSAAFAALVPRLLAEWRLSNTEAGWILGIYFGGYAVAVPVLVSLTDRIDARRVYLGSALLTAFAMAAFALLARGFWSALLLHGIAGMGLAGTYMPGLRMLTERIDGTARIRAVPYYTVNFGVGNALSFYLAGQLAPPLGWRAPFVAGAVGALVAVALVFVAVRPKSPRAPARAAFDFRPVFANRRALAYVFGYFGHTWELMAMRAWLVAFFGFCAALHPGGHGWDPHAATTLAVLAGVPASIVGAELAVRGGRRRVVIPAMLTSSVAAPLLALAGYFSFTLAVAAALVYGVLVMADSAALTAGAVSAARSDAQGATMAVHSLLGFSGGFLGPLAVGFTLDHAGGSGTLAAWLAGFAVMGAGSGMGALLFTRLSASESGENDC